MKKINFTDPALSLLPLQNALITVLDSMNEDIHTLMTYTSIFIWFVINASTILSFLKIRIKQKQEAA